MTRSLFAAIIGIAFAFPVSAAELSDSVKGKYLEARTCDVFTGPCFANADTGLSGRHAIMAWKIDSGTVHGTAVDGLSIVAVVAARDTLGLKQVAPAKAILIVDEKATSAQREALVAFAQKQGGTLLANVIDVRSSAIDIEICECPGNSCAKLTAGKDIRIETRCLDHKHDRGCGNEYAYYPPLASGVKAIAAMATESVFAGKGFNETWSETERRGAYVGTFATK